MKLQDVIATILIFCLTEVSFGQQAKLEGYVRDDNERIVSNVRITSPGAQPATTSSKGHFRIDFPGFLAGHPVHIQVAKSNWVIYQPMFGNTVSQSAEANFEPLSVVIVPKGSPLSLSPKRISNVIAELAVDNAKQRTEVSRLRKKLDRDAFLQKYADEYGMPRVKVIAAIEEWALIKVTDDNEERARKEYWLENYSKSASLALESAQVAEEEWEKANKRTNDASRKIIRRYMLAGNAFFAQYKFREALDAYLRIDQHFEKAKLPKEVWRIEWTELRRLIGSTKLALGERVEGEESERFLKEAIIDYQQVDLIFSKQQFPEQWATTQNDLSAAFGSLGIRVGGTESIKYLNEAVVACRAALQVFTQERTPQDWANAQHNLGIALLHLGERAGGDKSIPDLNGAVTAFRNALLVRNREQFPQDWAQTKNSLGGALRQLGARASGIESIAFLNEAFRSSDEALQIFTRARFSQDWAAVQSNLSAALYHLGIRANEIDGRKYLDKAVAANRSALQVFTRNQSPQHWARAQNNLGASLWFLAMQSSGDGRTKTLEEAVAALRNALEVRTREQFPQDWALTSTNLGGTLSNLAEQATGDESIKNLNEAVKTLSEVREVTTREKFPQDWARAQNNLGSAFLFLGERSKSKDESANYLKMSIKAYEDSLGVRTREQFPQDWALTQTNLGISLLALGKQSASKDEAIIYLTDAIKTLELSTQVFTRAEFPKRWSTSQSHLGGAKLTLGTRFGRFQSLKEAAETFRGQLEVTTREQSPQSWAIAQRNLGGTLFSLAGQSGKEDSIEHLKNAVKAYDEALLVFTKEQTPKDWASAKSGLGIALLTLGRQVVNETDSNKYLREAVIAFQTTLLIIGREESPQEWSLTQYNLGGAQLGLGLKVKEKTDSLKYLNDAVVAYRAALSGFTREKSDLDWARSHNNMGVALRTIGEKSEGGERVKYLNDAITAFRFALEIFTQERFPSEWSNTTSHLNKTQILLKD